MSCRLAEAGRGFHPIAALILKTAATIAKSQGLAGGDLLQRTAIQTVGFAKLYQRLAGRSVGIFYQGMSLLPSLCTSLTMCAFRWHGVESRRSCWLLISKGLTAPLTDVSLHISSSCKRRQRGTYRSNLTWLSFSTTIDEEDFEPSIG